MVLAVLIVATIADLALAALLIGVSGYLFGSGPESMHVGALPTLTCAAGVIACLAAPMVGFVFNRSGKTGAALAVAWLPVAAALLALPVLPVPS